MTNHIEQRDLAIRLFAPTSYFLFLARIAQLLGPCSLAAFGNEAVAIDRVETIARGRFRQALVLHELHQQVGDPQACAPATNDHDLLLCEWHAGDADSRDQR